MRERARELLKRVSERAKERARANIFEILNKFKKAIDVFETKIFGEKNRSRFCSGPKKSSGRAKPKTFKPWPNKFG